MADVLSYLKGLRSHLEGMDDCDSSRTKEILDQVIPALSAFKDVAVEIDENLVLTDSYLGEMARRALVLVGARIIERRADANG